MESDGLKSLKELAIKVNKEKYPLTPDFARVTPKYTDKTANGLTKCIVDFLNMSGYQAERISTTGRYIDNKTVVTDSMGFQKTIGSGKWIPGSGTKGSADISATIKGKSVKIEVKIGKDRQSDAQKKYQESIERAGGIYFIARNFDDFFNFYLHLQL